MSGDPLVLSRCGSCHAGFLPRPGPCPRCGSREIHLLPVSARGKVVAVTELLVPSTGWRAPHILAFVDCAEGIRLLVVISGSLPPSGSWVRIARDGELYRAEAEVGVSPPDVDHRRATSRVA